LLLLAAACCCLLLLAAACCCCLLLLAAACCCLLLQIRLFSSSHFRSHVSVAAGSITIVGFSMGCLPALACALSFGSRFPTNADSRLFLQLLFLIFDPSPPLPLAATTCP